MKRLFLLGGLLFCGAVQAKSSHDIPEKFIGLLSAGKTSEAVDFLFDQGAANPGGGARAESLKTQMKAMKMGEVKAHDLILEERYGAHYSRQVYLLVLADNVSRLEFRVSDVGTQWRLNGFDFAVGDDVTSKLKDDALRPAFRGQTATPTAD